MKKVRICFNASQQLQQRILEACKDQDRTISNMVKILVEMGLEAWDEEASNEV